METPGGADEAAKGDGVPPARDGSALAEPPFLMNGGLVMMGGGSGLNRNVTSLQSRVHRMASWTTAAAR